MKNLIKFFVIAAVILGFSANSFGQSTAYASTTATLIIPISITKTTDMDFGTVASSGTAGTIILDYSDGVTEGGGGGASIIAGGTPKTAVFHVHGEGSSAISVSIPPAPITLAGSVSGSITVSDFLSDNVTGATLSTGSIDIKVKATLNVPANTVAGTYTNTTAGPGGLFVTVNYN